MNFINSSNEIEKVSIPAYPKYSETDLWRKFCEGDERSFAYIYKTYIEHLYNFGFQLTKNEELTKDIIQDIFVKLRASNKNAKIKSIKSYLFKCFYTDWIKRSKKNRSFISLSECFAITLSFEERLMQKQLLEERKEYLKKNIEKLTVRQRQGIMLFFYEGMSYAEIAEAMDLKNAKSARKLLYRAVDELKPNESTMKVLYFLML